MFDAATAEQVISCMAHGTLCAPLKKYTHRYPHDWRSKKPVMLLATNQWFANVAQVQSLALEALDDVQVIRSGRLHAKNFLDHPRTWENAVVIHVGESTGMVHQSTTVMGRANPDVLRRGNQ